MGFSFLDDDLIAKRLDGARQLFDVLQAQERCHFRGLLTGDETWVDRVFHFEVSISAPRLDLGSKSQHILTLARAKSIWDFQPLGPEARDVGA
jgi:hypothetical protein